MKTTRFFFFLFAIIPLLGILNSCNGDGEVDVSENAIKMQEFIEGISKYAKVEKGKPGFIIIPQNGSELAFWETDLHEGIMPSYINAIDGLGIEELFYNDKGNYKPDRERLDLLDAIKLNYPEKTIMVADYVKDENGRLDSIAKNSARGFISFPRARNNYDYIYIPAETPTDVNSDNISALSDARNYLYLISTDNFTSRTDMITKIKATNYDVVLIDLFFDEHAFTPPEIDELKTKADGGSRLVIAYVSIGSAENYRYYWQTGWKRGNPSWLKKNYEGYPDEFWVEYWDPAWQDIIYDYIDKIIAAGFDGAYLDNVEAYYFLENN